MSNATDITYEASPTMQKFHASDAFVRTLVGPIGSGKSVACIEEMMMKVFSQKPYNNVRKSRWAIVRNTYRELLDTTMESFFDWIPKSMGHYSVLNSKFTLKLNLEDGTRLDAEFLFRALDKPGDIKKLLSLEVTGIWMNEARELAKAVLDMGMGRVGRYPSKRDGGPSWHGVIMDTNPPDSDHWYYTLFEEELPDNFEIFHQPSGMSSEAENIGNLPAKYYENMIGGKDKMWVDVYVHGRYGFISDGKPVYPEYHDDIHYQAIVGEPLKGETIYVGIDFGLTPAASICRKTPSGQIQIIDELVTFDMGAVNFGKLLHEKLTSRKYHDCKMEVWADPAGEQRAQTDEITPFMILSNQHIDAYPTYTNDPTVRREAVAIHLQALDFAGKPAMVIGPGAPTARKAFSGGYKYKRMQVTGEQRFMDKPDKNKYSHISDAIQYMILGAFGGDAVVGGFGDQVINYDSFDRMVT